MADVAARTGNSTTTSGTTGGSGSGSGPGWGSRLVTFYHGVMAEMRKVTWPDRAQVRSATIAILIFVMLLALLITFMDFVLQGILIKMIPSLFAGR